MMTGKRGWKKKLMVGASCRREEEAWRTSEAFGSGCAKSILPLGREEARPFRDGRCTVLLTPNPLIMIFVN
jgi:hypothetical protein